MSLTIIQTSHEALVSPSVTRALHAGLEAAGSAVLLVPGFAQALAAQRALAAEPGLALAVTTTTPSAWLRERWEVWGDGRTIADATTLTVLAHQTLEAASPEERGAIENVPGVVDLLARFVGQALPWMPLDDAGQPDGPACTSAGLTPTETRLMGLVGLLAARLAERGFVSAAEVAVRVPALLAEAGVRMPHVVCAGFAGMARRDRELVRGLAGLTEVSLVAQVDDNPASEGVRTLVAQLGGVVREEGPGDGRAPRAEGLAALREALFTDACLTAGPHAPVELLLPSGPVAEAELVAERVARLVGEVERVPEGEPAVVVAVPDVERAWRELVPKLVARGVTVRAGWGRALLDVPAARAFFSFARLVAQLAELDDVWPVPAAGIEGPLQQLGDMSWWPPRELVDFLLSDIAHVPAERAWRLDAAWRGNRLLSPARVLAMLQAEGDTSAPVARATAELLRGRVGTAASKLLAPYVEGADSEAPGATPASADGAGSGESRAALQAILQLAGTLRELGVTADASVEGAVSLSELVALCAWAASGTSLALRQEAVGGPHAPLVQVMGIGAASALAPASVPALVVCGLTTAEQPISTRDDLLRSLLEQLGVEDAPDVMAEARASFRALVGAPRTRLVLERALHDADAQPTYPAVMLAELLAAYGVSAGSAPTAPSLACERRVETDLSRNLATDGTFPQRVAQDEPAPAGMLTAHARELVFVPQAGSDRLPGGKPVLSASQVETYLDCPYKWFSLRRLRLGQVDAGHGGMEMGTFAHRVMEVTHRELLARALEAACPGVPRDELLAAIEADPVRPVAGSRVDERTLEEARAVLDEEFELHRQHMYMVRRPRLAQQLLVAHDSNERDQEARLREDLLSALGYQTRILEGFEPRLFEWNFGRGGDLVEYAGAYFTGTVDRIDVSPHGTAVIIDYKHKSPVGFAAEYDALQEGVLEGTSLPNRVQSLIYAQVVRRAFAGRLRLVGTTYLSTKSPHALAGAADENVADLVFGHLTERRAARVCVPVDNEGAPGMNALLDRTEELVAEQVERMLAGMVEARPRDRHSCDFCPVMQCERRVAR